MRYQVRFNNGFYKAFDTFNYTDVEIWGLLREVEDHVKWLNR